MPLDGEYAVRDRLFRTNLGVVRGLEVRPPDRVSRWTASACISRIVGGRAKTSRPNLENRRRPAMKSRSARTFALPLKAGPHDGHGRFPARRRRRVDPRSAASHSSAAHRHGRHRRAIRTSTRSRSPVHSIPTGSATRRAADGFSLHARDRRRRAVRPADHHDPGAPRVIAAGATDADIERLMDSTAGGRGRRLRTGHPESHCSACWPARSSCSASSATRQRARPEPCYRLSDLELASRLSFFLWSSIPDDELLQRRRARHAAATPAVLEQQVRRMLADPKSEALVDELRRPVAVPART